MQWSLQVVMHVEKESWVLSSESCPLSLFNIEEGNRKTAGVPPLPRQSRLTQLYFRLSSIRSRSSLHPHSLHWLLCLCVACYPSPQHDCCTAPSSFKDKSANGRGPSCMSGCGGQIYRGACQDAVYISVSSVDKEHPFGITHFLLLSFITCLKLVD